MGKFLFKKFHTFAKPQKLYMQVLFDTERNMLKISSDDVEIQQFSSMTILHMKHFKYESFLKFTRVEKEKETLD